MTDPFYAIVMGTVVATRQKNAPHKDAHILSPEPINM